MNSIKSLQPIQDRGAVLVGWSFNIMCERSVKVGQQEEYIISLVKSGGPKADQYEELNQWFQTVGAQMRANMITRDQIREMWGAFGDAFSANTMQGFVVNKPYGYAGDFEVIDKIYTEWCSPKENLMNWDKFFHWQKAPIAVRNRKEYFKELLSDIERSANYPRVLNIGSGPCRDVLEYQQQNPLTKIQFDCLDMDKRAIEYSKNILNGGKVTYYCQNVFRFLSDKRYDLVWSAGLFDYLEDKQFLFLFRSLIRTVSPGGELVIGNFSETNPSRDYMEFGEWFLHHRTESKLFTLAEQAGCKTNSIRIEREPSGVNLFVRVRKT
ncbi:MAG: class I SAM-dependent methyltransferase [Deltaproteobacteria bacterium]|nr:class I SAM-dependent methyltransferase [Deltaproteobacteria bacterium]